MDFCPHQERKPVKYLSDRKILLAKVVEKNVTYFMSNALVPQVLRV
jgi:hypothetical protein